MIIYKLTDKKRQTGHGHVVTTWEKGFTPPRLSGEGPLCSGGWYHGYDSPPLAVLHNPIHAAFPKPRCCSIEVVEEDIGRLDGQMKIGFRTGKVTGWIKLPEITSEQRVRYAILCVLSTGYRDAEYIRWARDWWANIDRSAESAESAAAARNSDLVALAKEAKRSGGNATISSSR